MAIFSKILLLAACSFSVIAGPVPRNNRRQLFARYANTSSIASTTEAIRASTSTADLSSELPTESLTALPTLLPEALSLSLPTSKLPVSTNQSVNAETVIVVEPIQQTVFTNTVSAITFLNPDKEPIVTEDPQTILSTSYITPTPAPTTEESSSTALTASITASPKATPVESSTIVASSNSDSITSSSSNGAVEDGTASETSQQAPMFTYSPKEDETGASFASPTTSATSEQPTPSSGGLPSFNHPGSAPQGAPGTSASVNLTTISSSSIVQSAVQTSPSAILASSGVSALLPSSSINSVPAGIPSAPTSDLADSTTRMLVTMTEYTTVFPSPSPPDAAPSTSQISTLESVAPTEAQNTLPAQQTNSQVAAEPTPSPGLPGSAAQSPSSAAAGLPTPLQPPPLVIITQYTTISPTPDPVPTEAPAASSSSPVLEPVPTTSASSSVFVEPSTSLAAEPTPTPPSPVPEPEPAPSSSTSDVPLQPSATESAVPPPAASPSTTEPAPAPTDSPAAPPAVSPSTTEAVPAPKFCCWQHALSL